MAGGGAGLGGVVALSAAVDVLLAAEWWHEGDAGVREAVLALETQVARLEAARLRLLAEADDRRVGAASGAPTTAAWLVAETRMRPERAAAHVALARATQGDLAATRSALAAGDLSADHAGVVTRAMGRVDERVDAATRADAEAFLVEQSGHLHPGQVARVGRVLVERLHPGADTLLAGEEDDAIVRTEVRLAQGDDGIWHLGGTLDPVSGARLAAALDPLMAPAAATGGVPDSRPAPVRRGAALVHLADAYLAAQTGSESSRPRLTVTVSAQTLADPAAPGAAPGLLAGGHPVSSDTLAQLACDAEVVPILLDPAGVPLDVGRTVYAFPDRLRRAILARDGGCSFPGCARPPGWCQVHHLVPFSAGGATSERNGTSLCGFHHRLVHRMGWRGQLSGAQVVWHPPDRADPSVPPPPWAPALDRLVTRWRARARAA